MTDTSKLPPELDAELDVFFDAARAGAPTPSAELLARVLDDATAVQAGFNAVAAPRAGKVAWWKQIFDDLGGVPALGGLMACACAGVYLGFMNPDLALPWSSATGTEETAEAEGVMSHALLGDLYWIEEG